MPRQTSASVENHFIGGLKTEFTGLSFPENACTATDNCVFSIVGEVSRRAGIDFELNSTASLAINTFSKAQSSYKWNNAGGDGVTQVLAHQIGSNLYFYLSSSSTVAAPLSHQRLATIIDLNSFGTGAGTVSDVECQYTDGNGYLFVFHPYIEPFYCTYATQTGAITTSPIPVKVRDFVGIFEPGVADNIRPADLSDVHKYNLQNQGWTQGSPWTATSASHNTTDIGSKSFAVQTALPIIISSIVSLTALDSLTPGLYIHLAGSVTSYNSGTGALVINCTATDLPGRLSDSWVITAVNFGLIGIWNTQVGNYPANADVWWRFKDNTDTFAPGTQLSKVTLDTNAAPKGSYILEAFKQYRGTVSSIASLTNVSTTLRPKTGTWFQGRVWYAGVDASFAPSSEEPFYSWTESIYFSQVIESASQFGNCFQKNDPTSENFFDLLPTDGGTIRIQGCGSVYKLFPVQNGLLVFAANGIWFITGSQGIGFSATDYTITKISSVQSISSTSFVNVLGWPVFWNEEGIYTVQPSQQGGGLTVDNLCLGTILSFYSDIPSISKKYVRGDYNPLDYVITWIYRDTNEVDLSTRYRFNKALNFNTSSKSFYPWTFGGEAWIHDIKYIVSPGGSTAPDPVFKYITSFASGQFITFSEEWDTTNWRDFMSDTGGSANYVSYFLTGFKLHGQALRKWQPGYIYMFNNSPGEVISYKIQGVWDWSNNPNSGRYSSIQKVSNSTPNYGVLYHRHKIRGNGLSLQLKIISVDGEPFQIIGWSMSESSNAGV